MTKEERTKEFGQVLVTVNSIKGDSLEKFLYWDCPLGFPDKNLKVYLDFEVGGAHEDWGWVIEYNGKIVGCNKFIDKALYQARRWFANERQRFEAIEAESPYKPS